MLLVRIDVLTIYSLGSQTHVSSQVTALDWINQTATVQVREVKKLNENAPRADW
jgi:hypothetical protein